VIIDDDNRCRSGQVAVSARRSVPPNRWYSDRGKEVMMDGQTEFVDCPEYVGGERKTLCGLPAEVESWYTISSTDGPLLGAKIRCPHDHWFNGPVDSLTVKATEPVALPVTLLAARFSHETPAALR
jgi:hypothetical protein